MILVHLILILSYVNAVEICPTVFIDHEKDIKLSKDEKGLVCGDSNSRKEWKTIPPWQARVHLEAMLQARGYHHSRFDIQQNKLIVQLGDRTKVSKLSSPGAPLEFDLSHRRKAVGEVLTPALLTDLQQWAELELQHLGYACPEVSVEANKNSGEVLFRISNPRLRKITAVTPPQSDSLNPILFQRYHAFHVDDQYDIWEKIITERRILEADLVSGTHFKEECKGDSVTLHHSIVLGPPRLFRIGFGLNSEYGPLFRVTWRHSRLDQNGSSLENALSTTFRVQEFRSDLKWYIFNHRPNFFLRPNLEVTRRDEPRRKNVSGKVNASAAAAWDSDTLRWELQSGPSWHIEKTTSGEGPTESKNLFIESQLRITSHPFEYFQLDPQSGYALTLFSAYSNKSALSDITAKKFSITGEVLYNFKSFSPPLLIFGVRTGMATTMTPDRRPNRERLPSTFVYFLGGSDDLRGFGLQEIPNYGDGALSYAFASFETRLGDVLPYQLQPYIFIDAGKVGNEALMLEKTTYYSPGLGMRWASPIGVFRVNAAHGFVDWQDLPEDPKLLHWQFYLNYGEEF